MNNVRTPTYRK